MGWDNDGHVQHKVFYFRHNNKGPWRISMPWLLLCICVMVGGETINEEKKKVSSVENIKVEPN